MRRAYSTTLRLRWPMVASISVLVVRLLLLSSLSRSVVGRAAGRRHLAFANLATTKWAPNVVAAPITRIREKVNVAVWAMLQTVPENGPLPQDRLHNDIIIVHHRASIRSAVPVLGVGHVKALDFQDKKQKLSPRIDSCFFWFLISPSYPETLVRPREDGLSYAPMCVASCSCSGLV